MPDEDGVELLYVAAFFEKYKGKIFRYRIKGQNECEDTVDGAHYGIVKEVIFLKNNDVMIGLLRADGYHHLEHPNDREYVRLSEIDLSYVEEDQFEE